MKKLLLVLAFLVGCTPKAPVVIPTDPIEREEYAIYSALINSKFGQSPFDSFMIDDQTAQGCSANLNQEEQFTALKSDSLIISGLEQSTIDSYIAKNTVKHQLSDSFSLTAKHTLISSGTSAPSGTDATYILLSAAGINSASNQALVCAGTLTSSKSGAGFTIGYYFLLQKENGVWVVKDQRQVWIS